MSVHDIFNQLDYIKFYSEFVTDLKNIKENQFIGQCPFHQDKKPSFSINSDTGQWKCFAGCGEGNIFTFIAKKFNINDKEERLKWLCSYLGIRWDGNNQGIIADSIWEEFHKDFLDNAGMLQMLKMKKGIDIDTVKKYKLGIKNNRLTIPIFDLKGKCRNIRYYDLIGKDKMKLMNHTDDSDFSYGRMRLFPVENFQKKNILLVEGETDCLLANQLGFNAVTVTSGAGSFYPDWAVKYFKDKKVFICYDIDQAGKVGSIRVAKYLQGYAEIVRIVDLSTKMSEPKNGDFSDFFLKLNFSINDFKELLQESKIFNEVENVKTPRNRTYKSVSLSNLSNATNAMMNVEVKALVSGKDFPPYEIPDKIVSKCDANMGDNICPFCPMYVEHKNKKELKLSETIDNGTLLNLIDVSDNQLFQGIRKQLGIPPRCNHWQAEILTYINIEELRLIPEIDFSSDDQEYVQQVVYYTGHGIKTNQVYNFQGLALPNPKTQQSTALFYIGKPSIDSIDLFEMTPEIHSQLLKFQPEEETIESLKKRYAVRYRDIEIMSGIYQREDIALAYDIVLHSLLNYKFQGKNERGWMELLLVGDSGCGKTELAKAMINHYKVGEFVTGENSSVAGLIGGLSQTAKKWHINWGKIPLNNRRAIFIDELSGMDVDDIALFSGIRSSGVAELTKIRTEKTMAQTRKIWIGNPRKMGQQSRNMMEFTYGCLAVKDLIGNLEDIRRFDFVVTAHSEEVKPEIYNEYRPDEKERYFTDEEFHNLILWAWSRTPSQIKFHASAVKLILKYASAMSEKYYHGIPIVEGADQRLKLARGAAAIAALFYSTNDGNNVVVKDVHVEFFYDFLENQYTKMSMKYDEWSQREIAKKHLKDQSKIDNVISDELVKIFEEMEFINLSDLIEFTGFERSDCKKILSTLLKNNAIKKHGSSYYRKTEAFILYLRKRKTGEIKVDHPADLEEFPSENDLPF